MFRKIAIPWYDTNLVCIATALFSLAVSLFSIVGIRVALGYPHLGVIWVPASLFAASTTVFISLTIRLYRRRRATG